MLAFFSQAYLDFFAELAQNNNSEWFKANKARYERDVKKPFEVFLAAFLQAIRNEEPGFPDFKPSQLSFRINRDIRFSADKSPYKLHQSAIISAHGKKSSLPGMYIEFGAEKAWIAGGMYEVDKAHQNQIRAAIAYDPEAFAALVNQPALVARFGSLQGEKYKVIPADWREAASHSPYIAHKQFYFFGEHPANFILRPDLLDYMMESRHLLAPFHEFLTQALEV